MPICYTIAAHMLVVYYCIAVDDVDYIGIST